MSAALNAMQARNCYLGGIGMIDVSSYLESLSSRDIVLFALGIIFTVGISHFYFKKTERKIKIAVSSDSYLYLAEHAELFRDMKITKNSGETSVDFVAPYLTRVYVWNSGNSPLRKEDIPSGDPLRLNVKNAEALSARILSMSAISNQFKLEFNKDNQIVIGFDYIDPGEGICVEVLCDKKSQEESAKRPFAYLAGRAIGTKISFTNASNQRETKSSAAARRLFVLLLLLYWFILAFFVFAAITSEKSSLLIVASTITAFAIGVVALAGSVVLWPMLGFNKIPRALKNHSTPNLPENALSVFRRNNESIQDNLERLQQKKKDRKASKA
jgi:hypothetical protein